MRRLIIGFGGLCAVLIGSCSAPITPPQRAAEKFLDAYYVNIDLTAAAALTEGYAASKVEEGQLLTAGQAIDASTQRPSILYKLMKQEDVGPDETNLLYELSITPPKASKFTKKSYIKVRRSNDQWKVALFREL